MKILNMGMRFLLELCMLVSIGYWGFNAGGSAVTKILLGIGSPILFAFTWGMLIAPKSARRLNPAEERESLLLDLPEINQ